MKKFHNKKRISIQLHDYETHVARFIYIDARVIDENSTSIALAIIINGPARL